MPFSPANIFCSFYIIFCSICSKFAREHFLFHLAHFSLMIPRQQKQQKQQQQSFLLGPLSRACFEIASFLSPIQRGKKRGNFKTRIFGTDRCFGTDRWGTYIALVLLSSITEAPDSDIFKKLSSLPLPFEDYDKCWFKPQSRISMFVFWRQINFHLSNLSTNWKLDKGLVRVVVRTYVFWT